MLGRLIVFEGPNESGKTTLSKWLAARLTNSFGQPAFWYPLPGHIPGTLGDLVYRLHHNPHDFGLNELSPLSLQALHVATHLDAIERLLAPKLKAGIDVVLDRYWWSTWVYGTIDGCAPRALDCIIETEKAVWDSISPSLIFLLDRDLGTEHSIATVYRSLAARESRITRVELVGNNGSLAEVQSKILGFLS